MACRYFRVAQVSKRKSTAFGVFPMHILPAGNKEPVMMAKGDAVVVPASAGNFHVQPQWEIKFIKSFVPGSRMPEPETRM